MAVFEQEGWFSENGKNALRRFADRTRHLPGEVLEVGCWEGNSTIALANAIHPATLHAIDHWQGVIGGGEEMTKEILSKRDVYMDFRNNIAELTQGNIHIYKDDWRQVFRHWRWSIRLLHIDGSHTFEEVADNIKAALPHMLSGGIICGDDYNYGPVNEAVHATLPNHDYDGLWFYIHP